MLLRRHWEEFKEISDAEDVATDLDVEDAEKSDVEEMKPKTKGKTKKNEK